jgi:hypothetical protein
MDSATADRVHAINPELSGSWGTPVTAWPARATAIHVTDRLHPGVFRLLAGTYGAMLLLLWLLFGTNVEASISLAICTAYFAVYFGVPWAMNRLATQAEPQPAPGSLGRFLRGELVTYTGRISGMGATVQMLIVPVAIVLAFACIGVIIRITS